MNGTRVISGYLQTTSVNYFYIIIIVILYIVIKKKKMKNSQFIPVALTE